MTSSVAPFLVFFLGALAVLATRGRLREVVLVAVPLIGALNLWTLADGMTTLSYSVFDYALVLLRVDSLSLVFGIVFHIAALLAIVFSLHVKDTMQQVAALIYAGSALGAVFAGDLVTLFVFWELLAISSFFIVLAGRTKRSGGAAMRYLLVQVSSGLLLLAGIAMRYQATGTLAFTDLGLNGPGTWLILLAFGIKAGFPLLHNWLIDAYPESSPTGAVFLSAFTTKVAVYALARGFPGTELLIYVGAAMTLFPIFYAVIENDMRRVLSYSMINQIGFMVCGIGLGTDLAMNGAVSHAFNDVIFKALLFMSMGAVLQQTGRSLASKLGGLYKTMPITAGLCIVGAASISGFPLFSAFVSKSMVLAAAIEQGHDWVWLVLLFATAGVFHHAGIKIPYFAFFAHDAGIRTTEPPRNMLLAMALAAALCIAIGCYPWALYRLLPFPVDYAPYAASHVLAQTQLLLFAGVAFIVLMVIRVYPPELPSTNVDSDWLYRKALPALCGRLAAGWSEIERPLSRAAAGMAERLTGLVVQQAGPDSALARTWSVKGMVAWVLLLLALYLVLSFAGM